MSFELDRNVYRRRFGLQTEKNGHSINRVDLWMNTTSERGPEGRVGEKTRSPSFCEARSI